MSTHIDNLWIFALASKCTQENIVYSFLIMALLWLTMNFFYWSHPGGPAWGKYYYSNSNNNKNKNNLKSSPMFIPGPNGYPLIGSMNLMSSSLAHHRLASAANKLASRHHRDTHLQSLCADVSRTLSETGALLVKDPRCTVEDNDRFIDMMEKYFSSPHEFKIRQERPHLHYQVGVTPEKVEVPRSLVDEEMQKKVKEMPQEHQPHTLVGADLKWRYFWRIGPRPSLTRFQELNAEPVIPEGFPEWKETMDSWGYKMIEAIKVVSEMAAIGFGLPKDAFTSLMKLGPHLLAPTGSDLEKYNQEGTIFAGYHYDLNFLTIHGRSRFPGLNIWLKNGQKVAVKVPVGCLLIQTGKQIEWLTGGDCIAGMHEVVVTKRTIDAINAAKEEKRSLWRVSSTLFAHIASDAVLKPLGHFAESPASAHLLAVTSSSPFF